MVDNEGDLADPDEAKRDVAVENHKRWVDAAAVLGCHSIRVNTFGTNAPEIWKNSVVDGLKKLSIYAVSKNINVRSANISKLCEEFLDPTTDEYAQDKFYVSC